MPAHHCIAVERVTGISRHILRPDVFGDDELTLEQVAAIEAATGGIVRAEHLRPAVKFDRDAQGRVTGYVVPIATKAA